METKECQLAEGIDSCYMEGMFYGQTWESI